MEFEKDNLIFIKPAWLTVQINAGKEVASYICIQYCFIKRHLEFKFKPIFQK